MKHFFTLSMVFTPWWALIFMAIKISNIYALVGAIITFIVFYFYFSLPKNLRKNLIYIPSSLMIFSFTLMFIYGFYLLLKWNGVFLYLLLIPFLFIVFKESNPVQNLAKRSIKMTKKIIGKPKMFFLYFLAVFSIFILFNVFVIFSGR